jgi:hypothetical protein
MLIIKMTKTKLPWEIIEKILILADNKEFLLQHKRYYALSKTKNIYEWVCSNGYLDVVKYLTSINIYPNDENFEIIIKNDYNNIILFLLNIKTFVLEIEKVIILFKYAKNNWIEYLIKNKIKTHYDFEDEINFFYLIDNAIEFNNLEVIKYVIDNNYINSIFQDHIQKAVMQNRFFIAKYLGNIVGFNYLNKLSIYNNLEYEEEEIVYRLSYFRLYLKYNDNFYGLIQYLNEHEMNIELKHIIDDKNFNYNFFNKFVSCAIENDNDEFICMLYHNGYLDKYDNYYINLAIITHHISIAKIIRNIFNINYNKNDMLKYFPDYNKTEIDYHIDLFENYEFEN